MTDFQTPTTAKSFILAFETASPDSVFVPERLFSITPRVSVTILRPSKDVKTSGATKKRKNYKIITNMTMMVESYHQPLRELLPYHLQAVEYYQGDHTM